MTSRARLLLTCATCAIVIGVGPVMLDAQAQTANKGGDVWTNGAPPLETWWFHGEVDVGGRFFLNNPQRDGVASQGGKSLAKYYEYSTIKPGPFSDIWLATGSRDGLYEIDVGGKNIGYSDQQYYLDASKAGEQYFNFGWDQTPHVYSTSAQTLYNGVGTTALTLPAGLGTQLFDAATFGAANTTLNPTQAGKVQQVINANVHQTDIGIRRDTASVEYRWTPTDAWDIRANYSNLHRTGTQVDGVVFTPGTSGVRVDAIKPVDDTTQNFGVNGEYAGTSFWGKKYTFKVGYNGSIYNDGNSAYTVQNPFCNDSLGLTTCPNSGNNGSFNFEQMPLWPDNRADSVTATLGADLPAQSRYMGTASYGTMRQNQTFLPATINPTVTWTAPGSPLLVSSLPASSLDGAINTLLLNNVVTTQITPDLKSKLAYRYYDYNNTTPQLFFKDWILADYISGEHRTGEYAPFQSTTQSYTKQNAGADLNWRPNREWNLGAAYGYERYNWYGGDADVTNENSGKVYADWKPWTWLTTRASYLYSARRFENYDNFNNVAIIYWPDSNLPPAPGFTPTNVIQNPAYRQLMFSDRDRNLAKLFVDLQVTSNLSITPTAGLQYDNYLNNVNLGSLTTHCTGVNCVGAGTYSGVPLTETQPGLKHNNSWNWGLEGVYIFTPDTTLMLSYMREYRNQQLFYCGNALPSTNLTPSSFNSTGNCSAFNTGTGFPSGSNDVVMKDAVDTFIARLRYAAIPNKLDLDVGYTLSFANASTAVTPGPFPTVASVTDNTPPKATTNGVTTVAGGPFPDQETTFQRVDVIARYKLDDTFVHQLGFKGEVTAKFRYAFESNRVTNWQNDMMQNYMWSLNNRTLGYMTWLAYNNPNYDVHLFGASLAFKW